MNIVPDQPDDAGRIDKGRTGLITLDQFNQRLVELLLAAVYHIEFL